MPLRLAPNPFRLPSPPHIHKAVMLRLAVELGRYPYSMRPRSRGGRWTAQATHPRDPRDRIAQGVFHSYATITRTHKKILGFGAEGEITVEGPTSEGEEAQTQRSRHRWTLPKILSHLSQPLTRDKTQRKSGFNHA